MTATTVTDMVINVNPVKTRKTGKAGRPAFMITLPSNKSFTIKDIEAANPQIKSVTIRAHILRALALGKITKLTKTVKTGNKGKPAHRFLNTKRFLAQKKEKLAVVA